MPLSFPSSPTVGQTSTQNGRQYVYAGNNAWQLVPASGGGSDSRWDLFLPPAPTSLTATAGNAQVAVSWTAPTVLAQTPITDYIVQSSTNSGSTWTTVSDGVSTATSYTVTGLTNGTPIVFRVAAVNGVGTGAYSSATSSVTPGDVFRAIPAMTSNTSPSGVVTGVGNRGYDDETWKAFDGSSASSSWVYFNRAPSNNPKRMVQYAFPDGQKSNISGYSFSLNSTSGEYIPRQWGFYGSDDLSNWTLLESRTDSGTSAGVWFGTSVTAGEARTFSLPAVANYRAFRWVFDETVDTGNAVGIREIALVE
jgi:hypothetical protein